MRVLIAVGALFCFIGIVSGAVGAHAFKALLAGSQALSNFNLAKEYMFYHGLGLIAVGILTAQFPRRGFTGIGVLFIIGSVLFQGSLYAYSVTGIKSLTVVTPVGGTLLMLAWLALALVAWRATAARK